MSLGPQLAVAFASISSQVSPHPCSGASLVTSSCVASTRIAPGDTTLEVTPVPASSRASETARLSRAAGVGVGVGGGVWGFFFVVGLPPLRVNRQSAADLDEAAPAPVDHPLGEAVD